MTDTDLSADPAARASAGPSVDEADAATLEAMERAEALVGRLLASYTAGAELLTVEVGRRLGLYAHLDVAGPSTVAELARSAQVPERYAREWLEQQGAAGLLDVVEPAAGAGSQERRFVLPAGHAPVLLDPESPGHVVGLAPLLLALARTVPALRRRRPRGPGRAVRPLRAGAARGHRLDQPAGVRARRACLGARASRRRRTPRPWRHDPRRGGG